MADINNNHKKRTFSESLDSKVQPNDMPLIQQADKKMRQDLEINQLKTKEDKLRESNKKDERRNDLDESTKAAKSQLASCKLCKKTFITQEKLEKHMENHHCKHCKEYFPRKSSLKIHVMNFLCKLCDQFFENNQLLKSHMENFHPGSNYYMCKAIKNKHVHDQTLYFSDKEDFLLHMKKGHGEKFFKCKLCYEEFHPSMEESYKRHMEEEHEKLDRELDGIGDQSRMYSDQNSGNLKFEQFIVQKRNLAHFCKLCQEDVLKHPNCREHAEFFNEVYDVIENYP